MSHRPHPINDDKRDAILFDDCIDCGMHARNLGLSLDNKTWMDMWDRMVEVEIDRTSYYRSESETLLGRLMYQMYVALERYTAINPKILFASWKLV